MNEGAECGVGRCLEFWFVSAEFRILSEELGIQVRNSKKRLEVELYQKKDIALKNEIGWSHIRKRV